MNNTKVLCYLLWYYQKQGKTISIMVINLGEQSSIFNQFLAQLRDKKVQKDSMRFRQNLQRLGEIFAYEISKKLTYEEKTINTPLGSIQMMVLQKKPVLATVLRAGLPLHQGILNFFDDAENAFISSYRNYYKDGTFTVKIEYISSPDLKGKTVILADPMLASGSSFVLAYNALKEKGTPEHVHFVSVIASTEGINYIKKNLPNDNISIWTGAIDEELTVQSFIVPGLGDAGDLAFGSKH